MIKLRDYQQETHRRLIENYNQKKRRNLCVLSTGMGKTFLTTTFCNTFQPERKTLFLVDRIELAHQAKNAFLNTNPRWKVGVEMDTHRASRKDDIVIASVHTVGRKGSFRIKNYPPDHFGKIFVDEAHTSISDVFVRTLSYFGVGPDSNVEDKLLCGLTATPQRTDGLSLGMLYDDIPVNYDLRYGIKEGWLTDIERIEISSDTDISTVSATSKDFDLDDLSDKLNNPTRNTLIYKAYKEYSNNESAIIFCSSVKHAYAVRDLFNANGVTCECIEANTDKEERPEFIEAYKNGDIKVLVNYGTLTTGFDAPETSTIVLARPIKSDLLLRQIIGRGLRPSQYAFVDFLRDSQERKEAISNSIKPTCKVISLCDRIGSHRIVSVPTLFGLDPRLKTKPTQNKFFEQVVEPIDEVVKETGVNPTALVDFDDIKTIVKRSKIQIESYEVPQNISKHSDRLWLQTGDDSYEVIYPKEKKTLVVQKNTLDKYDLVEYDATSKVSRKLNDFFDLSGAIKVADDFASSRYQMDFAVNNIDDSKGVTDRQFQTMAKILKRGLGVSRHEFYEDTGVPKCWLRRDNKVLNRSTANQVITRLFQR